jgi:hypothetical protein
VLVSRSAEESLLYMDLQPCPTCGARGFDWEGHHIEEDDGGTMISVYDGPCQRCGTPRRYEFTLADPSPGVVGFGGPTPSQIIDAGQFLVLAKRAAGLAPADPANCPPDERDDAREAIETAVAAVDEVLKFVPPDRDRVAVEDFWSEQGRAVYAADPGQFRRDRLDAVADAYRRISAAYSGPYR